MKKSLLLQLAIIATIQIAFTQQCQLQAEIQNAIKAQVINPLQNSASSCTRRFSSKISHLQISLELAYNFQIIWYSVPPINLPNALLYFSHVL